MSIRFYNTLSRALEVFESLVPGRVGLYTCGPTVYNFAHIGNFRAYMFEDLLHRHLLRSGLQVLRVMNLTDVDDKTIRGALAAGLPLKAFTAPFVQAFFEDLRALNILPADHYPAATDHVPEMIALVQTLLDKGHAYRSDDGSVYYRIDSFPSYGCLCHLDRSGLQAGARVAQDEYEKDNVADFALWKAWDEADGDVAWEAPWGRGRPGWHLECSAMSMRYLGPSFDLHTGGVDNMFPHHEDEIAQSEAATGQRFVRYWMHCAHLVVEGQKMSKSAGNFFTLRDLLQRGFNGREIRYLLLSTHYRQQLNFTIDGLHGARTALGRLDAFRARAGEMAGVSAPAALPAWAREGEASFTAALDDDLNISGALAALFDLLRAGNKSFDAGEVDAPAAAAVVALWADLDRALGLLAPPAVEVDAAVQVLAEQRQAARAAKNWKESDRLRDEIARLGWVVQDSPQGPKLKRAG